MQTAINNRYMLHESLGQGAMGIVYRATDRLSGETVAVKRVTIPRKEIELASEVETKNTDHVKLALTKEFQTLASLRHPHIISVLDYGFDGQQQPFFTMNYLSDAQNILEAGEGLNTEGKVNLLIQVLQALAYLHRRNILHRDLKPENVLVTADRLRVLDFGLSVPLEQARGRTGTLAYMAPETLQKGEAVEASDLYAVGVIAYQLFARELPFEVTDIMGMISRPADLKKLKANPELIATIERLLQKKPDQRFKNASSAISALNQSLHKPAIIEDAAIRESFLQAAKFVGRNQELNQLTESLHEAVNGRGNAWLIGGESGVGKTRLVEELRIRALVQGAQVLRGQAREGQGQPHHLWQGPLRRLALSIELDELQASVLKLIIPDIGSLLGKEVADAPELSDQEAAQRLILNIVNMIRRAAKASPPLVLLLEDIQWSSESVDTLASLSRIIANIPLLIIATYRTEEVPGLPNQLPAMHTMILRRLTSQAIAELSTSMLGESGGQEQILSLLRNETEGNAFFLVETVRALAEEAGSLQNIDSQSLPQVVFAGGVQRVIHRRLERVPEHYRPLLKLAAVAGRAIEPEVLHTAMPEIDLETWLTTCANVAVLEIHDEHWRFAHDKLRETLLESLTSDEVKELNNLVAEAIKISYQEDLSPHYGRLVRHFAHGGKTEEECHYAKLAGEYAASQYINDEALKFFNRALELLSEQAIFTRYEILLARDDIYRLRGEHKNRETNLLAMEDIAPLLGDQSLKAKINLCWASYYFDLGSYSASVDYAQEANKLALELGEQEIALATYHRLTTTLWRYNEFDQGIHYANQGLELARKRQDHKNEAILLSSLGMIAFEKRDLSAARNHYEQSLSTAVTKGYLRIQANALNNLGMVAGYQGNFQAAQDYYQQALTIVRKVGIRRQEAGVLSNLGWIAGLLGEYDQALDYSTANLNIAREINDPYPEVYGLINISSYAGASGKLDEARQSANEAIQLARRIEDRSAESWAFTNLGHSYLASGEFKEAADAYQHALAIRQELNQPLLATEPAAGLGRALLEQGDSSNALRYIQEILLYIERNDRLDGTDDPLRVYLNCYLIFAATKQADAMQILEAAYNLLQERAANIVDPATRHSFLTNIPHHQEIMSAWEKNNPAS